MTIERKMNKMTEEIRERIVTEAKAEIINTVISNCPAYYVQFRELSPTDLEVKLYYEYTNHISTIILDEFVMYAYIENQETGIRKPLCLDVNEMTACLKIMEIIKRYNKQMKKFGE